MTPAFVSFVETLFSGQIAAQYPGMPIMFSNTPVPDTVSEYVELHIMASEDTIPINVGITAKSRNVGVIQVNVYTPKDQGAGEGQDIAYFSGSIFKRLNANIGVEGAVVFKDPSVSDRGEMFGRHKHMVRIPYRYDFQDYT